MVAAMLYDRKCGKALTIRPGSNDHVFYSTAQYSTAQHKIRKQNLPQRKLSKRQAHIPWLIFSG